MVHARLDVTLPESMWIGRVSRAFPDAEFRLLSGLPISSGAIELGELRGSNLDEIARAVAADPDVETFDLLHARGEHSLAQYRTTDTTLYDLTAAGGIAPVYPMSIRNGQAIHEIYTPHPRLPEVTAAFRAADLEFRVLSISDPEAAIDLLTSRQREVIGEALRRGYYDTPRECTLTDLAIGLGVDKSSVSETLHRAEGHVIKWAIPVPDVANSSL